jgi:alpha-glucosidase
MLPHHDGSPLYVSTDSPSLGDVVRVRVRIPLGYGPVRGVQSRSNPNREPRYSIASVVGTTPGWDWWEAEIEVANPVHGYRFLLELSDGSVRWFNATGLHSIETLDSEDFQLVTYAPPPVWAKSTVLYQIFPDRFARSAAADSRELPAWAEQAQWTDEPIHSGPSIGRQFYGGDLEGIEDHLDHLERLGVTMIYLTPIFPAQSNHRYDALSFDLVDPLLGGDDALISLVEAAHRKGLGVIGDLTSNHSGDAHEWFRASHLHPGAPESGFYYWLDAEQRSYVSWLGFESLPKFNWNSAELRRRFIEGPDSVVAKWLEPPYSLDGWRIDVANMTGRYLDQDLNASVRQTIRATMIEVNPDTILLGESTNDASSDFHGDAWHGAMTYANFTRPIWGWLSKPGSAAVGGIGIALGSTPAYTGRELHAANVRFSAGFPWRVRLHNMNALDTHDTPRFRTSALDGTVPVAFGMAVSLPGIPVIFAGDEFGLVGLDGEHSRSPIPWDSVGEPATAKTIELYAKLIALRREHSALSEGGIRWLHVEDDVLVYMRESSEECVLLLAARADFDVVLDARELNGAAEPLFGTAEFTVADREIRLSGVGPTFAAWQLPGIETSPL